ncbi:MAG: LLM class flavin-dependent oxidoreductase, partial [Pseudomonadota bacterium]
MKLGIYINSQHPGDQDPARKFDEMIEQVRLMRQHGFDSLWAGEHHAVPPYHYFPLLGMLQRLSAEAEGMYLGTNIVLLPLHNPLEIAELGAFLDVLSGGKFILGVGLGYRQAEFDMFKVPIKQRVSRMVEGIEVIRRLWTEDNVSHKGRYWQLDDVTIRPQPLNKPSPPILIGAQVDASIKRAAEIADGWCIVPSVSTDKLTSEMEMFKSARAAAGKPETDQLVRLYEVVCAPDEETALKRATPYLLAKYESYAQWGMAGVAADPSDTPEVQLQKLAKNRFAVGSPAQLIE